MKEEHRPFGWRTIQYYQTVQEKDKWKEDYIISYLQNEQTTDRFFIIVFCILVSICGLAAMFAIFWGTR